MITESEILAVGNLAKPHGINGEITGILPSEISLDDLTCVVIDIDGIYVPFFIEKWRPKSSESVLIKFEGIDNEIKAKQISNKDLFVLRRDLEKMGFEEPDNDEEGFYASDLIGFTVFDSDNNRIGQVCDYDDQTENLLILVKRQDDSTIYLPLADDLIEEFDSEKKVIILDLPTGLIDDDETK